MVIYLGLLLPAGSSDTTRGHAGPAHKPSYLVLLQVGFTEPHCRQCAGELLPHLSTLTTQLMLHSSIIWLIVAVYLCCTFLRVAPTGYYPAPCPMELGLSSPMITHGSDHLAYSIFNSSLQLKIISSEINIVNMYIFTFKLFYMKLNGCLL